MYQAVAWRRGRTVADSTPGRDDVVVRRGEKQLVAALAFLLHAWVDVGGRDVGGRDVAGGPANTMYIKKWISSRACKHNVA